MNIKIADVGYFEENSLLKKVPIYYLTSLLNTFYNFFLPV